MSKDLFKAGTYKTPEIDFHFDGTCKISGRSIPDNVDALFTDVKDYLKQLINNNISVNLSFQFIYFNTQTQRYLFEVFELFKDAPKAPVIIWWFESGDEDIIKMGKMYREIFKNLDIMLKRVKDGKC